MGLRVEASEELEGLDLAEHGMHAYDLHGSVGPFDDAHLRGGAVAGGVQIASSGPDNE